MTKKKIYLVCALLVFLALFSFYTIAHPLYIYDTDDWTYIAYSRNAWPSIQQWNPTKILPETLMPFVAEIGVQFIMPLVKDYIESMALAFALAVAAVETLYFVMFIVVLRKLMNIGFGLDVMICIMIILFHFLPFNNADVNKYMLYGENVNCFFNYMIPALLNAGVMMYFIESTCEKIRKQKNLKSGFLILLIYLSINSNMFHSIILISFIGTELLCTLKYNVKKNGLSLNNIRKYVENNLVKIMIVICWLISVLFEANGRRAKWEKNMQFGWLTIKGTLRNFILSRVKIRKEWFVCLLIVMVIATFIFYKRKKNKQIDNIDVGYINILKKLLVSEFITITYLILLCAKVSVNYILESKVMFSWMFFLILAGALSLSYIVKKAALVMYIFPVALYILVFQTVIDEGVYAENTVASNYDIDAIKQLDDNIIKQVVEAEQKGEDSVEVLVPKTLSEEWPINIEYGGERISCSLYRHGIIHKKMDIKLIQSETINHKYNLPDNYT